MEKKPLCFDVAEGFAKKHYRVCVKSLAGEGVPWISLIGQNAFRRSIVPKPEHTHKRCIEIVYCRHGTSEYRSCGKTYRMRPGLVFVSRPDEPHRISSVPNGFMTSYLLFKIPGKGKTSGFCDRELGFIEKRLRTLPRLFDGGHRVGAAFTALIRLVNGKFDDETERRLRILNASISLMLSIIDAAETPITEERSERILMLADEMRSHPEKSYLIEELSAKIGFSPSSLLKGFKFSTGYSPHAFLIKCRMDRAKEMLADGRMKVTEIAARLGFPSSQHFAAQFRNSTGCSPRQWSKQQCS